MYIGSDNWLTNCSANLAHLNKEEKTLKTHRMKYKKRTMRYDILLRRSLVDSRKSDGRAVRG